MDNNGNLSGFLEKKVPTGMGRLKYKKSYYTLDTKQLTLTNFDDATMTVKGADRQAPGMATELNIRKVVNVLYQGGKKFSIKTDLKLEKFRAKSEKEALDWVTAIKKLVNQVKEAERVYNPVRGTTFQKGPGGKTGKLERLSPNLRPRTNLPTLQSPLSLTNTTRKELNVYKKANIMSKSKRGRQKRPSEPGSEPGFREVKTDDFLVTNPTTTNTEGDFDIPPPPAWIPPPPPLEEEEEERQPSKLVKKPAKPTYKGPAFTFRARDNTLIVSAGAGRTTRQTHGRITQLGTINSITKVNADSVVNIKQRKVVRPQTQRANLEAGTERFYDKSSKTYNLLHGVLKETESLANKLFKELDEVAVKEMVEQMFLIEVKPGDEIMTQNKSNNKFFIVETGFVEFFVKPKLKNKDKNDLSIFFEGSSYSMMVRNTDNSFPARSSMAEINLNKTGSVTSAPLQLNSKANSDELSGKVNVGTSKTEPYKPKRKNKNKKKQSTVIGEERSIGVRKPGVYFGEVSLLYEEPAKVTVRANTDVRVWAIERKQFHIISTEASQRQRFEKLKFLSKTQLFADLLNEKQLASLTEAVEYKKYKPGELIQQVGTLVDRMVWIKSGEALVNDENGNLINILTEDSSFGEIALLEKYMSEYEIVAKENCTVLELNIREVEDIIGSVREFLKQKILNKDTRLGKISKQQSIMESSGLTNLQHAVDQIKMTFRTRMTQRLTGVSTESIGDRTTGRSLRNSLLNPIDVNYMQLPAIIPEIELSDLCPITLLGSGCFGTVHLVKNCKEGRLSLQDANGRREQTINFFALKLVHRKNPDDSKWQAGLDHELQAWAEISYMSASPFVTTLFHSYADKGTVYFLAEYCGGGNLYETLMHVPDRRFKNLRFKQFYMANVLLGLEAIHERSIIFRDLKPENILIGPNGYLKITDFGLSKKSYRTFTVCGTPDYIAPEVVLSRGHDSASDFWALGVLLFEMSIGHAPFPGRDAMDKYEAVLAHQTGEFVGMEKSRVEIYTDIVKYEQRVQELRRPVALMRDTRTTFNSEYEDEDDLPEDVVFVEKFTLNLINRLIEPKKTRRIGVLASGFDGIRNHDFFGDFDWDACVALTLDAPLVPHDQEQQILYELENEEVEGYDLDLDQIPEDDTGYVPKVNSFINGEADFATLGFDI